MSVAVPGGSTGQDMRALGGFLPDMVRANEAQRNFRIFVPDETLSNQLGAVFEATSRQWDGEALDNDVLACCGDTPTLEILAAAWLLRHHLPALRVRVVNVVDLMKLQSDSEHPHVLSAADFAAIFTTGPRSGSGSGPRCPETEGPAVPSGAAGGSAGQRVPVTPTSTRRSGCRQARNCAPGRLALHSPAFDGDASPTPLVLILAASMPPVVTR